MNFGLCCFMVLLGSSFRNQMNIPKVSRCGCSGLALAGELLMVSRTHSKKLCAGGPAVLKPASREMISDSALQWNTVVCSLHIQEGARGRQESVRTRDAYHSTTCGFQVNQISSTRSILRQSILTSCGQPLVALK